MPKVSWRRFACKLILMGTIWLLTVAIFAYERMESEGHPTYRGLGEKKVKTAEKVLIAFMSIYIIWIFVLLIKNFGKFWQLPTAFRFLFGITVFTIILTMASFMTGFFFPISSSAVVFTTVYGLENLYIWLLAFAFTPIVGDEGLVRQVGRPGGTEYSDIELTGGSDEYFTGGLLLSDDSESSGGDRVRGGGRNNKSRTRMAPSIPNDDL